MLARKPAPTVASERASAKAAHPAQVSTRLLWEIVAIGAVLRLIALGHKSFWLDEIASVVLARTPASWFWHWLWHEEGNMTLYYVLLRPWLHLGLSETTVRLLSVIPGIASIPMMYLLAARLFGKSIGILAALLFALNTCAVVYAQEARSYSLLLLGTIAATYLFVRLVERPTMRRALVYALVAAATLYCHYFAMLVVASHLVSVAFLPAGRRPWGRLVVAWFVLGAMAVPAAWMIHLQDPGHLNWVKPPSWLELYHLGAFLAAESGKYVGSALLALDLVLIGFCYLPLKRAWSAPNPGMDRWRYMLVLSCLVTPILISLAISIAIPIFFHRFLIICLPAWILLVAVGVEQIRSHRQRVAAIAGVCLLSLISTGISYTRTREDWRSVARDLIAQAGPEDRVLYYEPIAYFAAENYRDWLPGGNIARPAGVMVVANNEDWRKKIETTPRVWLVTYPVGLHDKTQAEIEAELEKRMTVAGQKSFRAVTVTEYRTR